MYMRISMLAQSCDSVPPAPAWISRKASFASASPESSASSPRFSAIGFSARIVFSPSATVAASFSASPSSINVIASSSSCWSDLITPVPRSSCARSRSRPCAFWLSFQRLGSLASAFSSSRRRVALSQSKMPPQQLERLLDLGGDPVDFVTHGPRSNSGLPCRMPQPLPASIGENAKGTRAMTYVELDRRNFQTTIDGKPTDLYTIANGRGVTVKVTNQGAKIEQILVPDRNQRIDDVALGYESIAGVMSGQASM